MVASYYFFKSVTCFDNGKKELQHLIQFFINLNHQNRKKYSAKFLVLFIDQFAFQMSEGEKRKKQRKKRRKVSLKVKAYSKPIWLFLHQR